MSQLFDKKKKSEIEHLVDLNRLGAVGLTLEITPNGTERQALAKRFGFLDLPMFSARLTIDRQLGEQIVVEGRLRGRVVQACVLSLEPVTQELDDGFRLLFKPGLTEDRDPESGEALISAQPNAPEPLAGPILDVGEIVAEQLSLAANPYPRRVGVKLEDVMPKLRGASRPVRDQRRHPFAGLAALRDKPRRGR